ncbi:MAG: EAL domain-containing protein, partial [Gemmatimonadota bacterium]|nr:EAL domain-containing protein [Gemmatimonadota bacterium]
LWLMSRSQTSLWSHVLRALAFLPMNGAAAALALRASRRLDTDPRIRRALGFIAMAFGSVLLGNVTAFYWKFEQNGNPLAAWTNVPYFGLYVFGLAGLLSLPLARRMQNEYWKFMLDAGTVIVSGGLAIWYLVILPSSTFQLDGFWGTFFALAYPIASLLLLLGVVTVFMRRPAQVNPGASALLLAGLLLYLISDLASDLTILQFGWGSANWTDFVYVVAYVVIVCALARYFWTPPIVEPERDSAARSQPFTFLPYFSVATCYALLGVVAVRRWPEPMSVLAIGGIIITAIVVVRQMAAVRENVRLLSEQSKRENEARFEALVQHSSDVITIVDPDTVIRYASPTVLQIFGHQPHELEGKRLADLVHPDDVPRTLSFFMSVLPPGAVTTPAEWRMRHHDGGWRDVEVIGTNLLDQPTVRGIVLNTRDISERKALQAELTHQAFHDTLTGLANRALFLDRVTHALVLARRHSRTIAVIFLDLDNFKTVNDSLGHAQGDMLLIHTSERMQTAVRTADTIARFGGDEFAILIEDASDNDAAMTVVERVLELMRHPFHLEGKEVFASASIGIAVADSNHTASDLLRNADMAMYIAKQSGKGQYRRYETRMHTEAMERLELEADLRHAIEREEFILRYQPIVLLHTGEIAGVEALVRWNHPTRGMLPPLTFIPLAEETGLIVPLGRWVVREACRQAVGWQHLRPKGQPLTLTINISGHQLQGEHVVEDVRRALSDSGLDPRHLVLEITESVLMQQSETILDRLHALKALGVRLAIDDFGTGYSSLGYLQRFPIDILKIDKSFVDDVGRGDTESALARAVIALGETLQLQTIAEGIELKQQLSGLQDLGCELGQGFFFDKPIDPVDIELALRNAYAPLVGRQGAAAQG